MSNDEPTKLYHYTTIGGLMGILGRAGPNIHASDAQFLNDAQEIEFGLDLLRALFAVAIPACRAANPDIRATRTVMLNALEEEVSSTQLVGAFPTFYVTAFSDDGDLLSQWRAYGALGYCIEFDRELLEAAVRSRPHHRGKSGVSALRKVAYGDEARDLVKQQLVEPLLNAIVNDDDIDQYMNDTGAKLIGQAVAWSKHDAFREEREWRIGIQSPSVEAVQYRDHDNGPVGFVSVPLTRDAVTGVTIGPSPHADTRARSVRQWLNATGYTHVKLYRSTAPYRG